MNPQEFYRLVEQMRSAQKAYFRTRDTNLLHISKALERQVDDEIKAYQKQHPVQLGFAPTSNTPPDEVQYGATGASIPTT